MMNLYKKFFFHSSILIPSLLLIVCVIFVSSQKLNLSSIMFFIIGIFIFIISEYFSHRFLFHSKPPKNPFFLKFLKRLHYDHHAHPEDFELLFLPVWYSLPNLFLLSAIVYSINRDLTTTISFAIGLIVCLLFYEWKHYVAHQPIKPITRLGRWNKKNHILHHYKNENYWFGVSSPLVDIFLGTLKKEKEAETSKTVKNIENREVQS